MELLPKDIVRVLVQRYIHPRQQHTVIGLCPHFYRCFTDEERIEILVQEYLAHYRDAYTVSVVKTLWRQDLLTREESLNMFASCPKCFIVTKKVNILSGKHRCGDNATKGCSVCGKMYRRCRCANEFRTKTKVIPAITLSVFMDVLVRVRSQFY